MTAPNFRVDERKRFSKLTLSDGSEVEGEFWIDIAMGHLQTALIPLVMDGKTIIPLSAVMKLEVIPD